jgi:hypothetical protein
MATDGRVVDTSIHAEQDRVSRSASPARRRGSRENSDSLIPMIPPESLQRYHLRRAIGVAAKENLFSTAAVDEAAMEWLELIRRISRTS